MLNFYWLCIEIIPVFGLLLAGKMVYDTFAK